MKFLKEQDPIVASPESLKELAQELRKHDWICFDTEFIRESTFFPQLEIIQVASPERAWIVDIQAFGPDPRTLERDAWIKKMRQALAPLLDVFADPKIVKVLHAAQGDQECLLTTFGLLAKNTLDTAVAASLCGFGDSPGLSTLLERVLGVRIKKGHARTNWSRRPLPDQLIEYALQDVLYLIPLAKSLVGELEQMGRKHWAFELSRQWEDPNAFGSTPEEMAAQLAKSARLDPESYSVLRELVHWREKRVRELNIPKRWLADDGILVDIARTKPKTLEQLLSFRGLNAGEVKKNGLDLLERLDQAARGPQIPTPERKMNGRAPSNDESQALDVLKGLMNVLAVDFKISPRHLIQTHELLMILRSERKSVDHWVESGWLSRGAADLVGQTLLEFIEGKRALTLKDGRAQITKT